jgi:hypothetical protein
MIFLKKIGFVFLLVTTTFFAQSQETLPNFSAKKLAKNWVQISWTNKYDNLVQLTIQRSLDSTTHFRTIFSATSPQLPQNGYIDKTAPLGFKIYYRILYVFEGGAYYFTKSKQASIFSMQAPTSDTAKIISNSIPQKISASTTETNKINSEPTKPTLTKLEPLKIEKPLITIYKKTKDSIITKIESKQLKGFKDSIYKNTKDTIQINEAANEVIIKPFVPKPIWKPSVYLFTNEKGLIRLMLPLAKQIKYKIIFYDVKGKIILQIERVKESDLIIDKSNFRKAGWIFFELFENDQLKEKNKFYLGLD